MIFFCITLAVNFALTSCSTADSKRNDRNSSSNHTIGGSPAPAAETPAEIPGALDLELTNFTYPWAVKHFHFESQKQDLQMAYMDLVPTKSNGHTVILLHGKNFASNYWEPTAEALAEAGFRVIMIDQIGFGKSSKPEAYQFTLQGLASHTQNLLKSLGLGSYILIGHSMGGMLAVRFALMFPEKVEHLVLINPLGLEDWQLTVPYRTVDELYHQELHTSIGSLRDYMNTNYFAGNWKPEYERLIEIQAGWLKSYDYTKIAYIAALTTEMLFTEPVLYEFNRIRAPTLLVIGQRDRTALGKSWTNEVIASRLGDYASLGKKAQRLIPGSTLVEVPGAGHLPQVETFVIVRDAILKFLK